MMFPTFNYGNEIYRMQKMLLPESTPKQYGQMIRQKNKKYRKKGKRK